MNSLPIWIGMWFATNQVNNGVELTTFETTVIWILIALTAIVASVIGYIALKDYI